jgi:hypothetical protein
MAEVGDFDHTLSIWMKETER